MIFKFFIIFLALNITNAFGQIKSRESKKSPPTDSQICAPFKNGKSINNNTFFTTPCSSSVVPPTDLGGINVTSTYSGSVNTFSNAYTSCSSGYTTPENSIWLGLFGPFSFTFNFSEPVNNLVIVITATGGEFDEIFNFTTNTGNPTIIDNGSCFSVITGNVINSGNGSPGDGGGGGIFTIVTTVPFTSLTIDGPGGQVGSLFALCSSSVVPVTCNVGNSSPSLSTNILSSACPSTTVNLNSITSSNTPTSTGVSLAWFTGAVPSNANQLTAAQASNVIAGATYYAAFFDSINNCYSAVTPVTTNIGVAITPLFTQVSPICEGSFLAALPTNSNNGIPGSWSPAINNTATTTYTFTPTNPLCSSIQTMTIVVNQKIEPTFSIPSTLCYATNFTLPTLSNNGINGIWMPAVNNLATTTYTFAPNVGECATSKTLMVSIFDEFDFEIIDECKDLNYILSPNPLANSFTINSATYEWHYNTLSIGNNSNFNVSAYVRDNSLFEQLPLIFGLTITNSDGCSKTKQFTVESIFCGIQKGISANGDRDNDFFDLSLFDVKKLEIFNRYGVKVYSKVNYNNEWYGQTDNGNTLPDAAYYYVVEFNNNSESKFGWIYLTNLK